MGRYQVTAREAVTTKVAGITLVDGKATVDNSTSEGRRALAYFQRKGYQVEAETLNPATPTPPTRSASTDAWRAYAVEHGGLTADEAAALSRDDLAEKFLGPKEA